MKISIIYMLFLLNVSLINERVLSEPYVQCFFYARNDSMSEFEIVNIRAGIILLISICL